eukprot:GHVU01069546.1.p1 GENE.GHVU01069546.1~~GHVU01069546.1.p1  ORF type:complete len:244 (+),score=51.29 GHVU01069546.1:88-819(+)
MNERAATVTALLHVCLPQVVELANPSAWTPHAMNAVVRIFASAMDQKRLAVFYRYVLLPAIRGDVQEHKRLNVHYYEALRKSVFKPGAFMKGILLPLADEDCTYREALVLSSIVNRVSLPVEHGAAAIMKLCEQEWRPTTSYLLTVLINKKWSLPKTAVMKLVAHFISFDHGGSGGGASGGALAATELPVVWHRCLLSFVQRYKYSLPSEAVRALKQVVKVHRHHLITMDIHRELDSLNTMAN